MASSRVLIADDDRIIRTVIRRILSNAGYDVVEAADADAAYAAVKAGGLDVVLLDAHFADVDGYELLRCFQADTSFDIPVIMVTGRNTADDIARGLAFGAADHVSKPFEPAELIARIRAALARYQADSSLIERADVAQRNSRVDAVTGILNRRRAYSDWVSRDRKGVVRQGTDGEQRCDGLTCAWCLAWCVVLGARRCRPR